MPDALDHGLEQVRLWVWSGYHSAPDIHAMIPDIVDPGDAADAVHAAVEGEFARKAAAEAGWPAVKDCDRLDAIFFRLHDAGICALGNAGMTMSDGYSEVAEAVAHAPRAIITATASIKARTWNGRSMAAG